MGPAIAARGLSFPVVSLLLLSTVIGRVEMASGQTRGGDQPSRIVTLVDELPLALAVDGAGSFYFISGQSNLYRGTAGGTPRRIAGNGAPADGGDRLEAGDGGPALAARLNSPQGLAVDPAGNIFIADTGNARIRKVTPAGIISTVAGNGVKGFSGDGGPASNAQLSDPQGIAVDAAGNLYIADTGNKRVRKVTPDGVIRTVAGTGTRGMIDTGIPATSANLDRPARVFVDSAGNLYIADSANFHTFKVTVDGTLTTVARIEPEGIALDAEGNLFLTNKGRIARVTGSSVEYLSVAGIGLEGFSSDLENRRQIAFDAAGNLYIADSLSARILKAPGFRGTSNSGGDTDSNPLYLPGGDVTMPSIISRAEPRYTAAASQARVQGGVSIEAIIRKDGTVEIVRVFKGLGYGLDESAIAALLQWRFHPATRNGKPVDVSLDISVRFNATFSRIP